MATVLLKNGQTLELPFEEMLVFLQENHNLVQEQVSERPRRKRLTVSSQNPISKKQ